MYLVIPIVANTSFLFWLTNATSLHSYEPKTKDNPELTKIDN